MSMKGKSHTKETRKKISDANLGRILTKETCKKMSDARIGKKSPMFGKHHTEETTKKISQGRKGKNSGKSHHMFGKHHTIDSCNKISNANKGKTPWNKGKKFPVSFCNKIREIRTGTKATVTTRQKMSISHKKYYEDYPETLIKIGKKSKERFETNPESFIKLWEANRGKTRSKETCEKISKALLYNKNGWKGGISFGKYCPKFNESFKRDIRVYYHQTCMICGHIWQPGEKKHAVHHVYYNKKSCCDVTEDGGYIHTLPKGEKILVKGNPNKFVVLCAGKCHAKTNHNRLYWALFFEKIINEEYGGVSYLTHNKKGS